MTLIPATLMLLCPPTAILVWYTHTALGGSIAALGQLVAREGLGGTVSRVFTPVFFGSPTAWAVIGIFAASQLALLRLLPGPPFHGPVTTTGHVPAYTANGPAALAVTLALFGGASFGLEIFPATIVADHFGAIIGALNVFSLVFCLLLYLKGRHRPSTRDAGLSGHPVFDYYWGTDLYPAVGSWNVKMFITCRFGMMAWPLILLSFAAKQHQVHGLADSLVVAVALQLVYIAKFFWWETGYLGSLDITHDRAGFYICWGCLVWVPSIYTSGTLYLVDHPHQLGAPLAALILLLGVISIATTYWADRQREAVRATSGQCAVWGRAPVLIRARYRTESGELKENLLLASGFWGLARHFHYGPEVLGAVFWTLPVLFAHVLPWVYVLFLSILLTHRAFRDDRRCAAKYGSDWDTYRAMVPYKIIPGIF
jgi:7-dehydrocholesterol reductase